MEAQVFHRLYVSLFSKVTVVQECYLCYLLLQNSPEFFNQIFKDALRCYSLTSLKAAKISGPYISYWPQRSLDHTPAVLPIGTHLIPVKKLNQQETEFMEKKESGKLSPFLLHT